MAFRPSIAALLVLMTVGCSPTAQPPQKTTVAPRPTDATLIAEARRLVEADTNSCLTNNIDTEQTTYVIDLGQGARGVVAGCSLDMDLGSRIFIAGADGKLISADFLDFDQQHDGQWHDEYWIINPQYDAATRTLTSFSGNQPPHCTEGKWRGDGKTLVLVEMKRTNCNVDKPVKTVIWPTTPPTPMPTAIPLPN
ncbi:hypothetical protein BH10PSE2_BH10PSE2_00900 [soil metagenome]